MLQLLLARNSENADEPVCTLRHGLGAFLACGLKKRRATQTHCACADKKEAAMPEDAHCCYSSSLVLITLPLLLIT